MELIDPFAKLPSPVLLSLLKLVPDISSLRNLDKASPTVASLFDELGAEILQAVISLSLPESIRRLISTVVIIRSRAVPSQSLDDFRAAFVQYRDPNKVAGEQHQCKIGVIESYSTCYPEFCEKCSKAQPPFKIMAAAISSILRGVMDSACRIDDLAISCLNFFIDRCMALEIQECRNDFQYIPKPRCGRCPQRRPPGTRVQQENLGPPHWVEMQKTMRCFWRIQLCFDVKIAGVHSHLEWSLQDLERLGSLDIEEFWRVYEGRRNYLEEELATVIAYLEEGLSGLSTGTGTMPESVSLSQMPIGKFKFTHLTIVPEKPTESDFRKWKGPP